jgi:hypothetical protein
MKKTLALRDTHKTTIKALMPKENALLKALPNRQTKTVEIKP